MDEGANSAERLTRSRSGYRGLDLTLRDPALLRLADLHPDDLRDAGLGHRDPVEYVDRLHRPLDVGDEDELRPVGHRSHELVVTGDVGLIERCVDLVEN